MATGCEISLENPFGTLSRGFLAAKAVTKLTDADARVAGRAMWSVSGRSNPWLTSRPART